MKTDSFSSLLLVAALITMAFESGAQEAATADTTPDSSTNISSHASSQLQVEVAGDGMNRVGEPIFLTVDVTNIGTEPIRIANLNVSAPELQDKSTCGLQGFGEVVLQPGRSLQSNCLFSGANKFEGFRYLRRSLTSWTFRVEVNVNLEKQQDARFYQTITVPAQEYSIFAGGFAGAMLLAIFVWIQKLLSDPVVRRELVRNLSVTLLMGVRGGIMAIIFLLLSKTTHGTGAPLSVSVADFSGGLLVGLFSYPLANWISSTLKLDRILVLGGDRKRKIARNRQLLKVD